MIWRIGAALLLLVGALLGNYSRVIAAPPELVYPLELDTDVKKLVAVYSLLEQMRVEHNRQGAIARSDWARYHGKWAEYARIFKVKQIPLLEEQNRLRQSIRQKVYTDDQWFKLPFDARLILADNWVNEKLQTRQQATSARYNQLDGLKNIKLADLEGVFVDPTEDFTTFTEVDASANITIDANTVSWVDIDREANWRVYKDYAAGHFTGDFEHLFTINAVAYGGAGSQYVLYWQLANHNTGGTANPCETLLEYAQSSTSLRWMLYDGATGASDTYIAGNVWGTTYYVTAGRSGTTLTNKIYSDASRTILLDTLTLTVAATAFQYLYAMSSYGGSGAYDLDGWIEDLDLQETLPAAPTDFDAVYASDTQIDISWTVPGGVSNVEIRGKFGSYPATRFDGYQVYYGSGTSVSDNAVSFDEAGAGWYYRAYSWAPGGWSTDYAEDYVEGGIVEKIAETLLILGMSYLAWWRSSKDLYGILLLFFAAGILAFTGFDWFADSAGIGMMLFALGGFSFLVGILKLAAR